MRRTLFIARSIHGIIHVRKLACAPPLLDGCISLSLQRRSEDSALAELKSALPADPVIPRAVRATEEQNDQGEARKCEVE